MVLITSFSVLVLAFDSSGFSSPAKAMMTETKIKRSIIVTTTVLINSLKGIFLSAKVAIFSVDDVVLLTLQLKMGWAFFIDVQFQNVESDIRGRKISLPVEIGNSSDWLASAGLMANVRIAVISTEVANTTMQMLSATIRNFKDTCLFPNMTRPTKYTFTQKHKAWPPKYNCGHACTFFLFSD